MRVLGTILGVAGVIAAGGEVPANLVRRNTIDSTPLVKKLLDQRGYRLPYMAEIPEAAGAQKNDPKTKLIEALKLQIPSLKGNVIDKGKFDTETKTKLETLYKSGTTFLE